LLIDLSIVRLLSEFGKEFPMGYLQPTTYKGNVSHHSMTLVWNGDDWRVEKPCEMRVVKIGTSAQLRQLPSGQYQLRNHKEQKDFILLFLTMFLFRIGKK